VPDFHQRRGPAGEPGSHLTRREFVASLASAAAAASCTRRQHYDPRQFTLPAVSDVALLPASSYDSDLSDTIGRGLDLLGVDVRDKRVLLKPNMVEYEPGTIINTHPKVVAGAADALRRRGAADVLVGEGPGHRRDVEYLLSSTGLFDYLRDLNVRFVDLNHDDVRVVPLRSSFTDMGSLAFPTELLAADIVVSMPKLKTHHWAGMTCGMKNLFGTVPGAVYGWPKNPLHLHGINESIVDLSATIRPALTIVDAIVGMEGDGPIMGTPHPVGMIAIGRDPVAVDATCARVIGIDPWKLRYLEDASAFLGHVDERKMRFVADPVQRFRTSFKLLPEWSGVRL
jgi:uncharacterized protein (DUF362 family)